jgi:hypothetical protein
MPSRHRDFFLFTDLLIIDAPVLDPLHLSTQYVLLVAWVALSDMTHSFPQETRAVVETESCMLQPPLPLACHGVGCVNVTEVTRVHRIRDVA